MCGQDRDNVDRVEEYGSGVAFDSRHTDLADDARRQDIMQDRPDRSYIMQLGHSDLHQGMSE